MSLVLLKTILFPTWLPRKAASDKRGESRDQCQSELGDHKSGVAPEDMLSTQSTIDVEAQQRESDLPRDKKSGRKRRRFKLKPRMISDAIIGLSDGMTVPFALTAGLASIGDARLVVLGGLAELIAGAISMGLGGFIGAKSEADSYGATVLSTKELIRTSPCQTTSIVHSIFEAYGLPALPVSSISQDLHESPPQLLDFLMRFHHQMPEPATSRPFVSAATIAIGYFLGGFVPLLPYFCVPRNGVTTALWWSIGTMAIALFAFGWVKTGVVKGWRGRQNILGGLKGAVEMVIVGGIAAGAAVGLVRAIGHE